MKYLIFILLAFVAVFILTFILGTTGLINTNNKTKLFKQIDGVKPYKNSILILIIIICFALALALQISLYKNTSLINYAKLFSTFIIVYSAAVVDLKRKIIPNFLIISGLVIRLIILVYEIVSKQELKKMLISDLIGFAIGFVFLGLVSFVTKGMIGFGDAKLFAIIGIMSGAYCTYSTLFFSLIISLVVSLIGLILKKLKKKDSFPFGPCIAAGYVLALFLMSY